MAILQKFPELDPHEKRVLTFKFGADLAAGETLATPTVIVTARMGRDSAAQSIVHGSPQIVGTDVLIEVTSMLAPVDYHILIECTTSNATKVLVLAGLLPVRNA
jgi:hypothetical protein